MRKYGLIGKKLGHSFSKKYFSTKFEREGIKEASYDLYELEEIGRLKDLFQREPELAGLNVTIPYKQDVIPLLDELDETAAKIGAVNTIKIESGLSKGFNTDYIGFKATLEEFYPAADRGKALVLGTGGAAKAVFAALADMQVSYSVVSRSPVGDELRYEQITPKLLQVFNLIINTTPLGMAPNVDTFPVLPYTALTSKHYAYDLVYNPEQTLFLEKCASAGAKTMNGLPMLFAQAEAAWKIWNS